MFSGLSRTFLLSIKFWISFISECHFWFLCFRLQNVNWVFFLITFVFYQIFDFCVSLFLSKLNYTICMIIIFFNFFRREFFHTLHNFFFSIYSFPPNLFSNVRPLKIFHVKWSADVIWAVNDDKVSCFLFTVDRATFKGFFPFFQFIFLLLNDFTEISLQYLCVRLEQELKRLWGESTFVTCVKRFRERGSERKKT